MRIFLIILIMLVVLLLIMANYYGLFKNIEIKEKEFEKEFIVYKTMKGSYKNSGLVSDQVYWYLLNDLKIKTTKGLGLYYDNPKDVPEKDLRSDIGCIVSQSDYNKIEKMEPDYLKSEIPPGVYKFVEFPYRNRISVIAGIIKVYPLLSKINNANIMEVWDIENRKIIYRIIEEI